MASSRHHPVVPFSPPQGPLPTIPRQSTAGRISDVLFRRRPLKTRASSAALIPSQQRLRDQSSSPICESSDWVNKPTSQKPYVPRKSKLRPTVSYNDFGAQRSSSGLLSGVTHSPNLRSTRETFAASQRHPNNRVASCPTESREKPTQSTRSANHAVQADLTAMADGLAERRSDSGERDDWKVMVSVRVRPDAGSDESGSATGMDWDVDGKNQSVIHTGREGGEYTYDNVFTNHDTNQEVYDASARRLVRRVMEGYSGTIFAYGATGTGKTYSMTGTQDCPGVIPLAISDMFSFIRESPAAEGIEYKLGVSYLEIYNERIYDLLSASFEGVQQEDIKLREDGKHGVYAYPLKEEFIETPLQLHRVIKRGDNCRKTASTQFNSRSSRSHAIIQISVARREFGTASDSSSNAKHFGGLPGGTRLSKLYLIDLAGSERVAETKERRTEGSYINKSMLTLGTIISRLAGMDKRDGQVEKAAHLPFRDSKLTRLLQPALSGDSLISILCTVQLNGNSTYNNTVETLNTLKFAARASNNIVSHAKRTEEVFEDAAIAERLALLEEYQLENEQLRQELEAQHAESERLRWEAEERAREEGVFEFRRARNTRERLSQTSRMTLTSKNMRVNNGRSYSVGRASSASIGMLTPTEAGTNLFMCPSKHTPDMTGFYEEDDEGYGDGSSLSTNQTNRSAPVDQKTVLESALADAAVQILTLERYLEKVQRARSSSRARKIHKAQDSAIEAIVAEKNAEIEHWKEQCFRWKERCTDNDHTIAALRGALDRAKNVSGASNPSTRSVSGEKTTKFTVTTSRYVEAQARRLATGETKKKISSLLASRPTATSTAPLNIDPTSPIEMPSPIGPKDFHPAFRKDSASGPRHTNDATAALAEVLTSDAPPQTTQEVSSRNPVTSGSYFDATHNGEQASRDEEATPQARNLYTTTTSATIADPTSTVDGTCTPSPRRSMSTTYTSEDTPNSPLSQLKRSHGVQDGAMVEIGGEESCVLGKVSDGNARGDSGVGLDKMSLGLALKLEGIVGA